MRFFPQVMLMLLIVTQHSQLRADSPQPGNRAHYYVAAHFATGYWADKSDRFRCPVLGEVGETKVAIYVKEADHNTMHLAVALDHMLQKYSQLKRSFFIVSEENRDSSMTDEELDEKLMTLQRLGKEHGITKLSLGCLQYNTEPTRWRNKLGFFNSADVVIAVIEPGISPPAQNRIQGNRLPLRTVKPFYRYVAELSSKDINEEAAEAAITKALSSLTE